ncbi:hypothetical protein ASD11_17465 [Aeromicrobium sp. Root495]|nr:hypothetical protein ASD11_17465 [Aeromicrobium sp. Root495]
MTAAVERVGGGEGVEIRAFPETPTPWASTFAVSWPGSGQRCVVRLIRPDLAESDVVATEFAAAALLGDRGIGPAVLVSDVDAGMLVMEQVDGEPSRPASVEQAVSLAQVLRQLHGIEWDHDARLHVARRDAANDVTLSLVSQTPRLGLYGEAVASFDRVRAALRSLQVPDALCHNDLNPGNVLFDDSRAWLIDFDHLGHGDPLFDVATVFLSLDITGPARTAFLEQYFGREASAEETARLQLLSCLVLLRYGISALSIVPEHLRSRMSSWRDDEVGEPFVFARPEGEELGWSVFRLSLAFASGGLARLASPETARAAEVLGLSDLVAPRLT